MYLNSNLSSHELNSKSNGLVLLLNNKFRDCFLSFFAADGKDGHGPPFSCFNALPAKIARKILCSVFPDKICLKSPSNL